MLEKAKIYKKETTRPLTKYQKEVNEEAGMLALDNPALLCRRGDLLELAREKVVEKGYTFVKGKSRSKRLVSPDETPRPTRAKISAEVRLKRISALEVDIANLNEQTRFKEKRRQQAESIRNYKLCEEITEEIGLICQQKRKLSEELAIFREKERKAKWYQVAKRGKGRARRSRSSVTSDDSDIPLSSPNSSRASSSEAITPATIEIPSSSDTEHDSSDSVFPSGLPADCQ